MDNLEVAVRIGQAATPIVGLLVSTLLGFLLNAIAKLSKNMSICQERQRICQCELPEKYRTVEDAEKCWNRQEKINDQLFGGLRHLEVKTASLGKN